VHPDFDEYFMKFWPLLPIVESLQVDRQMASHPRNWTASAMHKTLRPRSMARSTPPMPLKYKYPSSLIYEIIRPSSSECPTIAIFGDAPTFSSAKTLPYVSLSTVSANCPAYDAHKL
jgi:hypothetical protein